MNEKPVLRKKFSKDERLTRRLLIEALYEKGESVKTPALVLVHRETEFESAFPVQVLFTVSKRNFKKAHDRNRIKRLLREAYRKQKHPLYTLLSEKGKKVNLMFIFTGKTLPNSPYIHGKISELLSRYLQHIKKLESASSHDESLT
jgi:ribonuclease P protein component